MLFHSLPLKASGLTPGLSFAPSFPVMHRTGRGISSASRPIRRQLVTWIPDLLLRSESHGDYRIVGAMPDRDGDHMYRIKSPLEEYERVVKEDLLVKSAGYLPEEAPARVSRHSSITLPTLQAA